MRLTQIQYEIENGIALVTLFRPDRMNAFTPIMRRELIQVFHEADQDDAVRVVVVTGAGKAFCAGTDLSSGEDAFDRIVRSEQNTLAINHRDGGGQVSLAICRCRKPVIGALNGHAVGVGITMTLSMDLRIAAEDAKIGFVFARRGVVVEACSSYFLPRLVGMAKAAELAYTGRVFLAREEAHSGLFNYVVPAGDVLPKAMSIAREIVENTSPVAVALNKALLWHGMGEPDPQSAHLIDSRCFFYMGSSPDAREGTHSFLEKRPPQFKMTVSKDMPDFYPWWKEPKT
jgi:enoyl-CoA hydratase/carnithine racemase